MEPSIDSWKSDNRQFLRNPSEAEPPRGNLGGSADDRYPEAPVDRVALTQSWERFCVLAVRIEAANRTRSDDNALPARMESIEAGPPETDDSNIGAQPAVEAVLEQACAAHCGFGFKWRDNVCGCVLPGLEELAASRLAGQLQTKFGLLRPESLTIGIALFPQLDYSRAAVFVNARKALAHASFFGPDGVAPFDAVSLNISGDECYQQGDLQGAMSEYREALRLNAADANVLNSLGVCQARDNDLGSAMQSFERVLTFKPQEAMAVFNLGVVASIQNDPARALAHFQTAWGMQEGKRFEIALALGRLLCDQNQWEQARPFLESALALRGDSAQAHAWMGRCLAALGLNSEALSAYTRAVKLNPNDPASLSALAELFAAKNENPEICLTFARQSTALAPDNALYHFRLGRLYEKFNQLDSALAEYERATALGHPEEAQAGTSRCRQVSDEPRQCCG